MSCSSYNRQSSEASGQLINAAHPSGHLAHPKISAGIQARSMHNTSTRRYRGSYLVLVIIWPSLAEVICSATSTDNRRASGSVATAARYSTIDVSSYYRLGRGRAPLRSMIMSNACPNSAMR
jgi:hypothetical protein